MAYAKLTLIYAEWSVAAPFWVGSAASLPSSTEPSCPMRFICSMSSAISGVQLRYFLKNEYPRSISLSSTHLSKKPI